MTEKARILFVDDERQILIALRALFRMQYQVFTADSGEAALEIIRREPIHAIVSDQRMPKMLGHELLREVKQISPGTMRLLLTGYADLSAVMHSINDGEVFRFIHKPWDNAELRVMIDNAMKIALDTMGSTSALASAAFDIEPPKDQEAGILVIDDAPAMAAKIQELSPYGRPIYHANNLEIAVDLLEHAEIAVIITDVVVNGHDTTDFIKLLKQQYPLLMTIVLTNVMDANMAVALINQGKIYRYFRKPVADALLHLSIKHGLRFYQTNKENPELLQRQKVELITLVHHPSLVQRLIGRLKAFRARFQGGF